MANIAYAATVSAVHSVAFSKWLNSNALMDDFLSEAEEHKAGMARQNTPLPKKQPVLKPVPAHAKTSNPRWRASH
jgi:hypothetical protein